MISATASLVLALVLGLKVPAIAPAVYSLRYIRREFFLFAMFVYCLLLSYEYVIDDIYSLKISDLAIVLATILLLEEGLNVRKRKTLDYAFALSMLFGLASLLVLFSLLILSFFYVLYTDRARKGFAAFLCLALSALTLALFKEDLSHFGSSATQAIVLSAFTAIFSLFWLRKTE